MNEIIYNKRKEPPNLGVSQWLKDYKKTKDRLIDGYYLYQTITGIHIQPMAKLLSGCCPKVDTSEYPVCDCVAALTGYLAQFVGKQLLEDDIDNISTAIAGWGLEFATGNTLPHWNAIKGAWGGIYVDDVYRLPGPEQRFACHLHVRQGPATGLKVVKNYRGKRIQAMMRSIGGSRFEQYQPMDLGGMWFTAWLCSDSKFFTIDDAASSTKQQNTNRKIMQGRRGNCTGSFRKDKPCHMYCPLGREDCSLARHKSRYKYGCCRNLQTAHKGYLMRDGYCTKCLVTGVAPDPKQKDENDES